MTSIEFILQPGESVRFDVEEVLFSATTEFQTIEIVRTRTFGKGVFIDRKPQSSEVDHFVFNEILVHTALTVQDRPEKVLMIGGGPGSGLAELVKYKSLREIIICDLDQVAVEAYQTHLPEWHRGSYNDPRVNLKHVDARKYLENLEPDEKKFDAIYIDIPDPLEGAPSGSLFSIEFYRLLASCLKPNGVVISQAGRTSINNLGYHASIRATLKEVFRNVESFDRHIPFYGEPWGFVFASNGVSPLSLNAKQIDQRLELQGVQNCRCYNGEVHHAMFVQPPYFKDAMARLERVHTDRNPLVVK